MWGLGQGTGHMSCQNGTGSSLLQPVFATERRKNSSHVCLFVSIVVISRDHSQSVPVVNKQGLTSQEGATGGGVLGLALSMCCLFPGFLRALHPCLRVSGKETVAPVRIIAKIALPVNWRRPVSAQMSLTVVTFFLIHNWAFFLIVRIAPR